MKVIQVVGGSSSGKTTFIRSLATLLLGQGSVAAVKHLGGHLYLLEPGRDTTLYYESGVTVSAGVDGEKSVYAVRSAELADVLCTLADMGINFAILEGWKQTPLPCIAIGDLEAPSCVLRNPEPDEVLTALDKFPDYHSLGELLRTAGKGTGDMLIGFRATGGTPDHETARRIEQEVAAMPGIETVDIAWTADPGRKGSGILLGAIRSADGESAIAAVAKAIGRATPGGKK